MNRTQPVEERPLSRRTLLRDAALMSVGGFFGPGPGIAWSKGRDILRIRSSNDIQTLDPAMILTAAAGLAANAIFVNLVQFQVDSWDWELDAAEYFEQLDDTRYAFRLRRGLQFTNGFGEITAVDVKYSLERIVDPALNASNAGDLGTLSHVEVTGRYSGVIVLASPFAAFIPVGLCSPTGSILCRKAMESVGGQFGIEPPCCAGPYRLKSWLAQRTTVLERNPDWTGPPAAFREIHVYAMTDEKAGELAYEAGKLDATSTSIESVEVFQREMPPDSRMIVKPSLRYYWIGMNQDHPKLKDIRVRQAIQWGIDVEAVIAAAWFDQAAPATGIIARGLIGHRKRADIPPRGDPDRARALLREAGVKLPLRLELALPSDSMEMTAGLVIQWSLKKIGIELELQPQDNATLITMGMESAGDRWRDLQLHLQSFFMLGDPYYATAWFVSRQVGVWNWERFRSEEFDRLHDVALGLNDPLQRDPLYQRMQHLMEASGCYRFLAHGVERCCRACGWNPRIARTATRCTAASPLACRPKPEDDGMNLRGRRLGILVHAGQGREAITGYFIRHLVRLWSADGIRVLIVRPGRRVPKVDLLINHVDMSKLSDEYRDIIEAHPNVINRRVLDIRKSVLSRHLVDRSSAWPGPVIVKTDLNYGGYPERAMAGKGPTSHSSSGINHPKKYRVFERSDRVPEAYFDDPALIVEKFLPERIDGRNAIRGYHFLGDAEDCYLITSSHPVINESTYESYEETDVHPKVRAIRQELGFEYGKFDYVVHHDEPIVFDTNKTIGYYTDDGPEWLALLRRRANALYPFFDR
ncbi:MAG: ABC transporter substrate-binding protein [Pseudomonadota bacterium]